MNMKNPAPVLAKGGVFLALILLLSACSGQAQQAKPGNILIVGDSLTAGYGLDDPENDAWPALLQRDWEGEGFLADNQEVVNAGISGDTTEGGSQRLGRLLATHNPTTVVIALGSNDVRRQLGGATIERNIDTMARQAQAAGATVLLVGVDLPTPLALAARGQPNSSIQRVAEARGLEMATIPLDDIFSDGHMLSDQIHPAKSGQTTIQQALEPAIRKAASH